MPIYYSNTTKGFYNTTAIEYKTLPADIIEITAQEHNTFLSEMNSNNKVLVVTDGVISIADRPTVVAVVTWDDIRQKRNSLLLASDYTQLADFAGDKTAWAAYRQTLRDITTTYPTPAEVVFPEAPN